MCMTIEGAYDGAKEPTAFVLPKPFNNYDTFNLDTER